MDTEDGQMALDGIKCMRQYYWSRKVLKYLGRYIQYMGTMMLVKNIIKRPEMGNFICLEFKLPTRITDSSAIKP